MERTTEDAFLSRPACEHSLEANPANKRLRVCKKCLHRLRSLKLEQCSTITPDDDEKQ